MAKERLRAIRKNATTTKATHTINGEMDQVILRNDGANDIRINFKTDNMANNYWTIKPGDQTPSIKVSRGIDIHYKSVNGPSNLEMILWA